MYGLGVRWLFVSRNGIKMQFLCVVGLKKIKFWLLSALASDLFTNNGKQIQICVSFVDSVIYHDFRDQRIFHPLFGFKSQIMTLSQKFQKNDFLGHFSFTQFFMVLKTWGENLKYLWRSYKDFGMYNMRA